MCHVSCVTCLVSRIMCHMSHVTIFKILKFYFFTKWWSLSVERLLSTGPTLSCLERQYKRYILYRESACEMDGQTNCHRNGKRTCLYNRLLRNFLRLPDRLICLSRIDLAERFTWFAWAGLIRLGRGAWFAWAGLIRLRRLPGWHEQDFWSCSENQAIRQTT